MAATSPVIKIRIRIVARAIGMADSREDATSISNRTVTATINRTRVRIGKIATKIGVVNRIGIVVGVAANKVHKGTRASMTTVRVVMVASTAPMILELEMGWR